MELDQKTEEFVGKDESDEEKVVGDLLPEQTPEDGTNTEIEPNTNNDSTKMETEHAIDKSSTEKAHNDGEDGSKVVVETKESSAEPEVIDLIPDSDSEDSDHDGHPEAAAFKKRKTSHSRKR